MLVFWRHGSYFLLVELLAFGELPYGLTRLLVFLAPRGLFFQAPGYRQGSQFQLRACKDSILGIRLTFPERR